MQVTTPSDLSRSQSALMRVLDFATPVSDWRTAFAQAIDTCEPVVTKRTEDGFPVEVQWEKVWKYLVPCIDLSHRPTAIDLFCGAGGFSLGIENAGFHIAVGVDIQSVNIEYHELNFPASRGICADVTKLSGKDIFVAPYYKKLALVVGSPPCQGFSTASHSNPLDPRNNLVLEYARLIGELQPQYFILENVPGLLRQQHAPLVNAAIQAFRDAGYVVKNPRTLNAVNFGCPQFRERVFLIGWQEGLPGFDLPRTILPKKQYVTAGMALCDLPDVCDLPELLSYDSILLDRWDWGYHSEYSMRLRKPPVHLSSLRDYNPMLLNSCRIPTHNEEIIDRFSIVPVGKSDKIARKSRLKADRPALTIRAGTGRTKGKKGNYTFPAPIHYKSDRVISVLEAKRLFGTPDWFRVHPSRLVGGQQIGNSVPPPLAQAIGEQVRAIYRSHRYDLRINPSFQFDTVVNV
jgi:DNA (cytosine-5)-methyltransferase 1